MSTEQSGNLSDNLPGHYITPENLRIGLYVHLDLGWMDHPFTFSNFKIKDEEQILKIRALNLEKIRYDPSRSDVLPDFPKTVQMAATPAAPEPLLKVPQDALAQSNRLKKLDEIIAGSQEAFAKSAHATRIAVHTLADQPEHARKIAENLVKNMVNSVVTESDVVLHAINGTKTEHTNYVHSLNVTVLALMLAKSLDMRQEEVSDLGVAALFHDVGKSGDLQQRMVVDLHCETGASIALRSGMSERISKLILQHHEYMDGSGFPMHIQGNQIDPLARVISLVNHYDNLCNPANPAEALTPYEALSKMYVIQQHKFDSTMLNLFIKLLGIYPPGSVVQLSNGFFGIVIATNPNKPLLPMVMLYIPEVARETPVVIDLGAEKVFKINKCLRPSELPPVIFDYLRPGKRVSYYFLKKENIDESQTGALDSRPENENQADLTPSSLISRAQK